MINWLKSNKNRLSLRAIEIELGIPETTLSQATRENDPIKLPEKWIEPLRKLAIKMSYLKNSFSVDGLTITEDISPSNGLEVNEVFIDEGLESIGLATKKATDMGTFEKDPLAKYEVPEKKDLSSSDIEKMVDENKSKKTRRF